MNSCKLLNIKNDYYPFGSLMPGRSYSSSDYRYGFNGKESDNEVSGNGNSYDYGFRIYNPRIAKFLSVDPLTQEYPWLTPYQYASLNPIAYIDIDGLEGGAPVVRPSRPALRHRAARNNRAYNINRAKVRSDYQKVVERQMNQQHKFEVANYSRDVLPRINGTEYIKPLGGNATPQSNTKEGELIYRVYELVKEIKDFSEKTDFKYANEEQTSVIRGATQYDIGFENDLKLQSLQKEYNTAFHKELLGSNTQEEFNNLSEVEKLGRQFSAGMKLGPSPVSIVNEFLKDAVKDGKTIETKKYTVTKATVSQAN